MLEQLSLTLVQLIGQFGFIGVFLASTLESFFIPVPAELIAFTAGYYARSSGDLMTLAIMCIVTTLGNYVGAAVFYTVCRRGAETFLPRFIDRWGPFLLISNEDLDKAQTLFKKHGGKMVFFSKFLPVIKNLIDFPAGLSQMPFTTYSTYTIAGSLIRNVIYATVGYFVYEAKDQIFAVFQPIERFLLLALGIAIAVYVIRIIFRIRQLELEKRRPAELARAENDL